MGYTKNKIRIIRRKTIRKIVGGNTLRNKFINLKNTDYRSIYNSLNQTDQNFFDIFVENEYKWNPWLITQQAQSFVSSNFYFGEKSHIVKLMDYAKFVGEYFQNNVRKGVFIYDNKKHNEFFKSVKKVCEERVIVKENLLEKIPDQLRLIMLVSKYINSRVNNSTIGMESSNYIGIGMYSNMVYELCDEILNKNNQPQENNQSPENNSQSPDGV